MSYQLDILFTIDTAVAGKGKPVKVVQAYGFAFDPTPVQERAQRSHASSARFARNWGLPRRREWYARGGKMPVGGRQPLEREKIAEADRAGGSRTPRAPTRILP